MNDGQKPPQADNRRKFSMTERRNGGIRIRPDLLGILIIIIQLGAMVWWASRTTTRVGHLEENDARTAVEYRAMRETQVELLTEMSALTQAMTDRGLVDNSNGGS